MPQTFLDSHIHLWPASAANAVSHRWMQPGAQLTKQYSTQDYLQATSQGTPEFKSLGFVYVETDRTISTESTEDINVWAAEPLKEIEFLRGLVEGTLEADGGFPAEQAASVRGIVAYAPLDRPMHDFLRYMAIAEKIAGEKTWNKIKGFRFLVQGILDEDVFRKLLDPAESSFVALLKQLGNRHFSFDVGVDQRQGGVWQLERFAETMELTHKDVPSHDKTIFILNHLCKPDMEQQPTMTAHNSKDFERWKAAISRMAKLEKVYMKLSGAFSEIRDQDPANPMPVSEVVERMKPWLDHIFAEFGPWRIMYGSDWPVCNVRGPGDAHSWIHWTNVVQQILRERSLSSIEMDRIWHGTAIEAYRLD